MAELVPVLRRILSGDMEQPAFFLANSALIAILTTYKGRAQWKPALNGGPRSVVAAFGVGDLTGIKENTADATAARPSSRLRPLVAFRKWELGGLSLSSPGCRATGRAARGTLYRGQLRQGIITTER